MIKEITFKNAKEEKITGILKEKDASSPLIIVCHGYKSSHNHPAIESITDKLYQLGDATFAFNFSQSAQGANLIQQVSDLQDIITHFKDHKKFILLAGSFGSLSTVIASTTSSRVHGLVTINGFFGYKQLGPNLLKEYLLFRIASIFNASYRKNWRYLHKNLKPEKIDITTLMMHARKDSDVAHSQSKRFFQKINAKKEFYLLETADHNLTRDSDRQEVAEKIDKWVRSHFPS